jgi:hypothetical protein
MERRNFMKAAGALAVTSALSTTSAYASRNSTTAAGREIYEWRIYTLTGNGAELDKFYKDILIPAYNRKGITVGAFKPQTAEENEMRHIVFIYPDMDTYYRFKDGIWEDAVFTKAAQSFYDATAPKESNLFSNYETYLSEAFSKIPKHRKPDSSRGLFEIRIYWSPNEEANKRKVKMFNVDEIDVFDKVGINSVLYGDIMAGPKMPALMYLTWYKSVDTRTEAWDKFGKHPDWQRIRSLPEYANTATNNQSTLLTPLPYSQL